MRRAALVVHLSAILTLLSILTFAANLTAGVISIGFRSTNCGLVKTSRTITVSHRIGQVSVRLDPTSWVWPPRLPVLLI